jgi:GT2 family glycosyltransferase
MSAPSVAVLVLNWNGINHLRELLPSLREAVAATPFGVSVVVVDNRSTEPDVEYVRREFPDFEVEIAERNDFLFSLNPIVARRSEEVVVILNNDMRVEPDFLPPLVEHFAAPDVFAVMAKVMNWDGSEQTTGQRLVDLRRGWLYKSWNMSADVATYTVEAGGGCSAYRRSMFVELGGFDPLFRPGYYEDLDLSYRAWQYGWSSIFEPRSVIYHRIGGTLYDPSKKQRFETHLSRNQALFIAKNVGGAGFLAHFLAMLPVRIVRNRLAGNRAASAGLIAALPHLPRALRGRGRRGRSRRLSDASIAAAVRGRPSIPRHSVGAT